MSDLVSVGGICFVSGDPPKRKYRPRGSRTRKEQQRDAARKYYLRHKEEIILRTKARHQADPERYAAYQRKYNAEHRAEINAAYRAYYAKHRELIRARERAAYRRRKEKLKSEK